MADAKDKKKKSGHGGDGSEGFGDAIRLGDAGAGLSKIALVLAVAGIVGSVALGGGLTGKQFQHSYLAAFMWGLSICVGAVWWVTLQHLVNAKWSTVVRRIGELLAQGVGLMAILALPLIIPILRHDDVLYPWVNHDYMHSNHALHSKVGYLNTGFFLGRCLVYFGYWFLLARFLLKASKHQDESGDAKVVSTLRSVSAPAMILFALTLTFCAIDFLMTLDPIWFSTIFGVYYFAGCVLAFHSTLTLSLLWLQSKGKLSRSVTAEHYHDIGKMMFAFTAFWTYIAFSQFMLIWYANIPEETHWYHDRFMGSWLPASIFLAATHFVIPFFGMMSRHVKRNKKAIGFWAVYVLAVHWFDMHWLVGPKLHPEGLTLHAADFTAWIGVGGAIVWFVLTIAKNVNLVPTKDPRLEKSLAFENI